MFSGAQAPDDNRAEAPAKARECELEVKFGSDDMLAKRIIPCLDIAGGRVVKGVKFLQLRDAGDPVEQARAYERQGADELTFLDITASHEQRDTIVEVVKAVARQVFMPLTVGGGIRACADVRRMLLAGADKVSLNTAALQNPDIINEASAQFGSQCIVLAIDARKNPDGPGWGVYTHGGRRPFGRDAIAWAQEGVAAVPARFCSPAWTRTA